MGEQKTDAEKLEAIVEYAKGLRIWGSDVASQFATDILFMAGAQTS